MTVRFVPAPCSLYTQEAHQWAAGMYARAVELGRVVDVSNSTVRAFVKDDLAPGTIPLSALHCASFPFFPLVSVMVPCLFV